MIPFQGLGHLVLSIQFCSYGCSASALPAPAADAASAACPESISHVPGQIDIHRLVWNSEDDHAQQHKPVDYPELCKMWSFHVQELIANEFGCFRNQIITFGTDGATKGSQDVFSPLFSRA